MCNFFVVRPVNDTKVTSSRDEKLFWSGIEMMLYLVKYSRPDIENTAREWSKVMDGADEAAILKMHQLVKYVLGIKILA